VSPALLVRTARQASGLTQKELARRLGTTQTAVARLERARSNPTFATLERALNATGHRLEITVEPVQASVDEEQIRRHVAMTPSERALAHDAAYRNLRESLQGARKVDGGLA
jgi:transcriptional regulator with XRE-family HTH domain